MNVLICLVVFLLSCRVLYLEGQMIALKHTLGMRANESFDFARDKVRSLIGEEEDAEETTDS